MKNNLPFCKCGCGKRVSNKRNMYILGHHRKGIPTTKGRNKTKREIQKQKNTIEKFGRGYRNICLCGCGQKVKTPHSKYCLGHNQKHKPYQIGQTKDNSETIRKILKSREWYKHSNDTKKKIGKKSKGRKHSNEYKEILRQEMLNGKAAYLNRCMKNPSVPQVKLYKKVLKICPYAILNYPYLNYSIDIAIPFLNIAIEYDGYFHFNSEESKEYHKRRQTNLEKEGWKFIRYNIYQEFPSKKEVRKDILNNGC